MVRLDIFIHVYTQNKLLIIDNGIVKCLLWISGTRRTAKFKQFFFLWMRREGAFYYTSFFTVVCLMIELELNVLVDSKNRQTHRQARRRRRRVDVRVGAAQEPEVERWLVSVCGSVLGHNSQMDDQGLQPTITRQWGLK